MAQDERRKTDYVVLKKWTGAQGGGENTDLWHVIGTTQARSKNEAIRLVAQADREPISGKFKAVPANSWKGGLYREVEMQPKVTEAEIEDDWPPESHE